MTRQQEQPSEPRSLSAAASLVHLSSVMLLFGVSCSPSSFCSLFHPQLSPLSNGSNDRNSPNCVGGVDGELCHPPPDMTLRNALSKRQHASAFSGDTHYEGEISTDKQSSQLREDTKHKIVLIVVQSGHMLQL